MAAINQQPDPNAPPDPNTPPPDATTPPPDASKPYQDIAYWQAKGYGYNDMFDTTTGQMKPGWSRTANGYELDPNYTPPTSGGVPPPSGPINTGPKITDPFTMPPPSTPGYVAPPIYRPPPPLNLSPWKAPSVSDALNDPGYQFRTQQGAQQLQNWAGAKGTLNDSSTAKALQDYGQNAASSEYQNVWNRDFGAWQGNNQTQLQNYNTNYGTQYTDPYAVGASQAKGQNDFNQANYADQFQQWLTQIGLFQDQRDSTWNKNMQYAQS